ncbi:mechanosensitive ion channel family protein [Pelobium manganitolerans]|nr:mechanosensitive ion channel family protein [Pelobium manganitolerans]
MNKLTTWFENFVKLLPNLVIAALIIVLGFFIAKVMERFALKMVQRISRLHTVNKLFASFVYFVVVGIALFTALDVLNLDKAVTTALAGAGILGLALAFAFQDIASNFISGIFMSFRRPFNVGDLVELGTYKGRIDAINLRDTALTTLQGQRLIIPNKQVFQNPILNYSSSGIRRLDMKIGVSQGDDLEKVRALTIETVSGIEERNSAKDVEFYYEEFADSCINFKLRIWLKDTEQKTYLTARSKAIILIKKAYDEAGFTLPFPIRTLDFAMKGGQSLSEVPLKIESISA